MPKKIILAGGGTGGHVYPALAMGDALRAAGHEVLYYGDGARLEGRVAPERGYVFRAVKALQYPRAGLLGKLRFLVGLLASVAAAREQVKADAPSLILGVGGYVMAPTVLAAWTLGIPSVIHESNVAPGLANKLCARVARMVLLTYADSRLPGNAEKVVVGCPVNPKILKGEKSAALLRYGLSPGQPVLLVVGGSLGAATINAVGLACAKDPQRNYQIVHVTGPKYFDEMKAQYGTLPPGVALLPYEDKMGEAFAASSLVVCRAGSSTLAELAAVGMPSLLIPSPNVTDNHQEANARGLEKAGAAEVVVEKGLDPHAVAKHLRELLGDEQRLAAMASAARALAKPEVAGEVARLLGERFLQG